MKLGVVFYHKNLEKIYKKEWIDECLRSIENQTVKDLFFYEIDYGDAGKNISGSDNFYSMEKENYADAMNFIISKAFEDGCDYVFNTNLDDKYALDRIEKQIRYLELGYDIVSSDFMYINENGEFKLNLIVSRFNSDIENQLENNHNVIAHPVVGYSRNFWENNKYDITKTPEEDLHLWKKSINEKYKFYIIPEILLMYRIHNNQVSTKNK
jgi:hypothetical protein